MLDCIHTRKFLRHASSHEKMLKVQFIRCGLLTGGGSVTTTDLKEMLKTVGIMPRHVTGAF